MEWGNQSTLLGKYPGVGFLGHRIKCLYLSPRNTCFRGIAERFYIKTSFFVVSAVSRVPMPLGERGFLSLGDGNRPAMELHFLIRWSAPFTQGTPETCRRGSVLLKTGHRATEEVMAKHTFSMANVAEGGVSTSLHVQSSRHARSRRFCKRKGHICSRLELRVKGWEQQLYSLVHVSINLTPTSPASVTQACTHRM